jgi:hypothetical protein
MKIDVFSNGCEDKKCLARRFGGSSVSVAFQAPDRQGAGLNKFPRWSRVEGSRPVKIAKTGWPSPESISCHPGVSIRKKESPAGYKALRHPATQRRHGHHISRLRPSRSWPFTRALRRFIGLCTIGRTGLLELKTAALNLPDSPRVRPHVRRCQ